MPEVIVPPEMVKAFEPLLPVTRIPPLPMVRPAVASRV